jgi:Fe-S cluster biogenesis protein NfuA
LPIVLNESSGKPLFTTRKEEKHNKALEYLLIFFYHVNIMDAPDFRKRVENALERVRIGLKTEGGDIELVDVKDGVVYVKLKGACGTCPMSALTMKNWVETSMRKEIPEIKNVQAV